MFALPCYVPVWLKKKNRFPPFSLPKRCYLFTVPSVRWPCARSLLACGGLGQPCRPGVTSAASFHQTATRSTGRARSTRSVTAATLKPRRRLSVRPEGVTRENVTSRWLPTCLRGQRLSHRSLHQRICNWRWGRLLFCFFNWYFSQRGYVFIRVHFKTTRWEPVEWVRKEPH